MTRMLFIAVSMVLLSSSATFTAAEDFNWQPRGEGYEPFAPEELLAVRAMKTSSAVINEPPYVTEIEDEDENGTIIRIVKTDPGNTGIQYIYRFRMQGTKIVASAAPLFKQAVDEQRRNNARAVAEAFMNGDISARPKIYDGYLYKPKTEGKCRVEVDEFNTDRELQQTYDFNFCR